MGSDADDPRRLYRPHRTIVPMDVLPVWPEIEKAARDGYEELAEQGLPYDQLEAFLDSPEMADETVGTLAERARRFLARVCGEEGSP